MKLACPAVLGVLYAIFCQTTRLLATDASIGTTLRSSMGLACASTPPYTASILRAIARTAMYWGARCAWLAHLSAVLPAWTPMPLS